MYIIPYNSPIELTDDFESSLISGYGYDAESGRMSVRFRSNGSIYHYDVSRETYEAFLDSQSKGKYFHQNIKAKQVK